MDPTPKQILKRSEKIRKKWDEKTRLSRLGFSSEEPEEWTLPCLSYYDLICALKDQQVQVHDDNQ